MRIRVENYFFTLSLSVLFDGSFTQGNQAVLSANQPSNNARSSSDSVDVQLDNGMRQLMNVSSIDEVMNLGILKYEGHPLRPQDIGATINATTGKLAVSSGSSSFPTPDMCSPRDTSVSLSHLEQTAHRRIYPECVRVPRCGGCCGAKDVMCMPVYQETKLYTVLELSITESSMSVMRNVPVEVKHHVTCECQCQLSEEKCGPLKNFDANQCTCTCKDQSMRCPPSKIFNPETCTCECEEREVCCNSGENCDFEFDEQSCSCEIKQVVSAGVVNSSAVERYLNAPGIPPTVGHAPINQPTTTTTTTTTTAATTTTGESASTTQADCTCPSNMVRVYHNGSCTCQQNRSRSRSRSRGRRG